MWTRRRPTPTDADAATGWLDVGDGHRIHFEDRGPRDAPVALLLHGGPGSSASARQREWLDARRWRIVQFDQRGCGLSTPLGGLAHNDTRALVADIERLRAHLRIERWTVGAGSWGAALALLYAAVHRAQVVALVLRGVFLAGRDDLDWFFDGVRALAPDAHAALMAAIPRRWRADPVRYLAMHLAAADGGFDDDHDARNAADAGTPLQRLPRARARKHAIALAFACQRYEAALEGTAAEAAPAADADDARRRVARYRVQMHYLVHGCFIDDGAVLRAASTLHGVPVAIVHGEHDLTCRPCNARALQRACPDARLAWARGARHHPFHPATAALLRDAGECLLRDGDVSAWPSHVNESSGNGSPGNGAAA